MTKEDRALTTAHNLWRMEADAQPEIPLQTFPLAELKKKTSSLSSLC